MKASAHTISIFITVWRLAIIARFLSSAFINQAVLCFLCGSWKQAQSSVWTLCILCDKFSFLFGWILHPVIKEKNSLPSIIQILVYFIVVFTTSLFKAAKADLYSSWLSLLKRMKLIATPFSVPKAFSVQQPFKVGTWVANP